MPLRKGAQILWKTATSVTKAVQWFAVSVSAFEWSNKFCVPWSLLWSCYVYYSEASDDVFPTFTCHCKVCFAVLLRTSDTTGSSLYCWSNSEFCIFLKPRRKFSNKRSLSNFNHRFMWHFSTNSIQRIIIRMKPWSSQSLSYVFRTQHEPCATW